MQELRKEKNMVYMGQEEDHNLPKDSISNHFYEKWSFGIIFYTFLLFHRMI